MALFGKTGSNLEFIISFCFSLLSSNPTPRYLWGVVATDGRAEDLMDQKHQGVTDPPGSPPVGEISDGPQDLLYWAVVCQSDPHSEKEDGGRSFSTSFKSLWLYSCAFSGLKTYLGTSPKTVTPKRTPSLPTKLSLKLVMMAETKSLTWEKLLGPTFHDSSTRNTMSACATVLHAERGKRRVNPPVPPHSNHQIAVLLCSAAFNVAGEPHKSPWIFNEAQVSRRNY